MTLPWAAGATATPTATPTPSPSVSPPVEEPAAGAGEVPDDAAADSLSLTIADLAPAVARPGDTLRLEVTLINTTAQDLTTSEVIFRVQQEVPTTRTALQQWFDPDLPASARPVHAETFEVEVPAGSSVTTAIVVGVDELGFPIRYDNWGARGIEVAVVSGDRYASARTMGTFYPDEDVLEPDLDLVTLLPITASAAEWRTSIEEGTAVAEIAAERLTALAEVPGVTWGLDPLLLSAQEIADSQVTGPGGVGSAAESEADGAAPSPQPSTTQPSTPQGTDSGPGAGESTAPALEPSATESSTSPADPGSSTPGTPAPTSSGAPEPADETPSPTEQGPVPDVPPPTPGELLTETLILGAGTREVIALPWADADLTAFGLSGGSGSTVLSQAITRAREQMADVDLEATSVVWPAPEGVTADLLGDTAGSTGAVLTGSMVEEPMLDPIVGPEAGAASADTSDTPPASTPTALGTVETSGGQVPVLVADAWIGEVMAGEVQDAVAAGTTAELAQRQLLLAQTAVITREDREPQVVLAALERSTAGAMTPEDARSLADAVTHLFEAPWITSSGVAEALQDGAAGATEPTPEASQATGGEPTTPGSTDAPSVRTVTLPETTTVDVTAFRALASGIEHTRSDLSSLASALEPADVLTPPATWATAASAAAWRVAGQSGTDALEAANGVVDTLTSRVSVSVPESQVNLLAEESAVPVVVINDLDVTLTARIVVDPEEQSLRAPEEPQVTLAPGATTTVRVPVVAIANGTTLVDVSLYTPDGLRLGQAETFEIRVRAEWESLGIGIVAAVFGVLLVIGILRAARRGRRRADGHVPPRRAGRKT
ncbi:hypothetical protein ATL40_2791 [Serinibacter salmoneus]|uniref:Uncharacterized protein n=1 Tax=Serinibacter salmoneus TaxID=556530 RepID=A0A2A9D383_9MICO|nr:hypothetical protein ATL40_2791 [Serinibacter salmoneus]